MTGYHASPIANRKSIERDGLTRYNGKVFFWFTVQNAEVYGFNHDVWEAEIDGPYVEFYPAVAYYVEYDVPCPTLLLTTNYLDG